MNHNEENGVTSHTTTEETKFQGLFSKEQIEQIRTIIREEISNRELEIFLEETESDEE